MCMHICIYVCVCMLYIYNVIHVIPLSSQQKYSLVILHHVVHTLPYLQTRLALAA